MVLRPPAPCLDTTGTRTPPSLRMYPCLKHHVKVALLRLDSDTVTGPALLVTRMTRTRSGQPEVRGQAVGHAWWRPNQAAVLQRATATAGVRFNLSLEACRSAPRLRPSGSQAAGATAARPAVRLNPLVRVSAQSARSRGLGCNRARPHHSQTGTGRRRVAQGGGVGALPRLAGATRRLAAGPSALHPSQAPPGAPRHMRGAACLPRPSRPPRCLVLVGQPSRPAGSVRAACKSVMRKRAVPSRKDTRPKAPGGPPAPAGVAQVRRRRRSSASAAPLECVGGDAQVRRRRRSSASAAPLEGVARRLVAPASAAACLRRVLVQRSEENLSRGCLITPSKRVRACCA